LLETDDQAIENFIAIIYCYRTHFGSIKCASRLSISLMKQRLSLAVAWSKVISKFFTKLLQRSIPNKGFKLAYIFKDCIIQYITLV